MIYIVHMIMSTLNFVLNKDFASVTSNSAPYARTALASDFLVDQKVLVFSAGVFFSKVESRPDLLSAS